MGRDRVKFVEKVYRFECKMSNGTIYYPTFYVKGRDRGVKYWISRAIDDVEEYEKFIRKDVVK